MSDKMQPVPTPFSFGLGKYENGDVKLAALRLDLVTGEIQLMTTPEYLIQMGQALIQHGKSLQAGSLSIANPLDLRNLRLGGE